MFTFVIIILITKVNVMSEDINRRIEVIIKNKGLNAGQFADEIGVQRSSISHILSGRNKPSIDFIQKLLLKYKDINSNWLLTGNGISPTNAIQDLQLNVVNSDIQNQQQSLFDVTEKKNEPIVNNKRIEKIVTFYTDKTFVEYLPE